MDIETFFYNIMKYFPQFSLKLFLANFFSHRKFNITSKNYIQLSYNQSLAQSLY